MYLEEVRVCVGIVRPPKVPLEELRVPAGVVEEASAPGGLPEAGVPVEGGRRGVRGLAPAEVGLGPGGGPGGAGALLVPEVVPLPGGHPGVRAVAPAVGGIVLAGVTGRHGGPAAGGPRSQGSCQVQKVPDGRSPTALLLRLCVAKDRS